MPTYEYECGSCAYTFDAFQSINDAPLSTCPECGKSVRRLINGGAAVLFRGSGFYKTDSAAKGAAGADKTSATGSPGAAASAACQGCPAASAASENAGGGGGGGREKSCPRAAS